MVSVRRRPKSRVPSPNSKAPTSPNSDVPAKPSSEVQAHRSQSSAQRSQLTQAQTSSPNSEAPAQKSPSFAVLERAHVVPKRFVAFVAAELTRATGDHELTRLWAAAPGGHGLKQRFAMHSFGHVRKYRGLPWQRHARISFNWQRLHKRVGQQGVCSAALSHAEGMHGAGAARSFWTASGTLWRHSFVSGYVTAGRLLRLRAAGQWREEGREKRFLGFTASPIGKPGPNVMRRSALYRIPHFAVVATRPTL